MLLIDQLKEVYIDGQLETIDTTNWFPRVMRKDYIVGLTGAGSGPDPDQDLQFIYGCGGELNYNGYCSAEVDGLIEQQSSEADQQKRKQLVWAIERKLAEDGARPIIFYDRRATCWQPRVNGLTLMVNSLFNGWRMEDAWWINDHQREQTAMKRDRRMLSAAALLAAMAAAAPAAAQKQGGILHAGHFDSPASMSMLEESTLAVNRPMMGVFNNLVMFDQQVAQNSPQSIVPDLAMGWSWNEEGTELTMPLRRGVKWHDGRPFTAKDVKCTWDLLTGRGNDKLRINPRKSWYDNLDAVTVNGDFEVTFRLKRPQPSFLTLLASGWSPVYPCHVSARDMRQHPIGTGPFKFVEFKPNVSITLVRNPDYWKPGRPYLDGIEWTIVKDTSTRLLSFIAGQADVYFGVTFPQLQDVEREVPDAICDNYLVNGSRNLIVNRGAPPFDNPELRRAMSLTLDRQAFIDIIGQGQGAIGGPMEPQPEGLWGMPAEMLKSLPGYGPDVAGRRAEARQIMEKLGYGPDKRLAVTVAARNVPAWRDPALILIDQLKQIYIDGELEPVDTTQWYPRLMRKEFKVGLNVTESEVDDPDAQFYENYSCSALRNYTGYCNKSVDELIDRQSQETNADKRRQLVWQIERKLIEEDARPDILYVRGITCRRPYAKGLISMVNSIYDGSRFEDVWLDN